MQVGVVVESRERLFHGLTHAHLIDVAHVEHVEALLVDEALLARIDAADADLTHPRGLNGWRYSTELGQLTRSEPAQAGGGGDTDTRPTRADRRAILHRARSTHAVRTRTGRRAACHAHCRSGTARWC